nr:MAG TPA: hypothetical protein [Caudoviricetes sp.]
MLCTMFLTQIEAEILVIIVNIKFTGNLHILLIKYGI